MAHNKSSIRTTVSTPRQETVTGSCYEIHQSQYSKGRLVNESYYCVDFGNVQGGTLEEDFKINSKPPTEKIPDKILVTHPHADHCAGLSHTNGKSDIYVSEPSAEVLKCALHDDFSIFRQNAQKLSKPLPYSASAVDRTIDSFKRVKYNRPISIGLPNTTVVFYKNPHILGASSIEINTKTKNFYENDSKFLFLGDYKDENRFFDIPKLSEQIQNKKYTAVFIEATYGDTTSDMITKGALVENTKKFFFEHPNGTALYLVFSLGRAQEALYELKLMQMAKELDINIPIYYDGPLSQNYTNLMQREPDLFSIKEEIRDFLPKNIHSVCSADARKSVMQSTGPKIIVTSSGMGTHGPAQLYLPYYASNPDALIHATGYAAENTTIRRILETPKGEVVQINGALKVLNAEKATTNEFSAHITADKMEKELENMFKRNVHIDTIVISHGEKDAKKALKVRLERNERIKAKHIIVMDNKKELVFDAFGLKQIM